MALSPPLPTASFLPDGPSLRLGSAVPGRVPPRERNHFAARTPYSRERRLTLVLVALAHAAALVGLSRLAPPTVEPLVPPLSVALIAPPRPLAPPAPTPPEPVRRETPPPPKVVKAAPKPAPKPQPRPMATPAPAPEIAPALATPTSIISEAPTPPAPPPPVAAPAPAAPAAPVVVAARFDAAYLNNPAPAYPPLARRMREEGQVLLRVRVSAEGLPLAVHLKESSGSGRLDAAARDAVERWRFVPARQDDRPVEAWVVVPIVFKLEGH